MQPNRRRDFVVGACLFVVLLIVAAVAQYRDTMVLWDDAHLAYHAHEFVEALDDLLLTVEEAEKDHTYYMMSGDDTYLKSYASAIDIAKHKIEVIKELAANSIEEQNRIPRLKALLKNEIDVLATSLALRKQKEVDPAQMAALVKGEAAAMDALQDEVEKVQQFEQGLLQEELQAHGADHRWALLTIAITASLSVALLVALAWLSWRHQSEQARLATVLSQRAEALQEAGRQKDHFLAILAHELRNPLAPISNALQLWPMVDKDPKQMEEIRGMMDRQVRLMTRLIDELLDVSRISRGKIELKKQNVDLRTIVLGAVESLQSFIDACGHRLTVTLPHDEIMIDGDVARLTQVLGNILHNAAKYCGRNGRISITAEREGERAVIRIRDNGPGIPRHMLSRIFDMFQQADQSLDRSYGGLGIGLTLVKRLVEMHGGTVEAHSDGPGKGSEFVVKLLALKGDVALGPASQDALPARELSCMTRHRILVVDDVQASATTLAMILQGIGQDVKVAQDGPSALDEAARFRPQLVLLDIGMPGMDGYEVARRLRASRIQEDWCWWH